MTFAIQAAHLALSRAVEADGLRWQAQEIYYDAVKWAYVAIAHAIDKKIQCNEPIYIGLYRDLINANGLAFSSAQAAKTELDRRRILKNALQQLDCILAELGEKKEAAA